MGQTSRQTGSAQWLHSLGSIKREAGASRAATSLTSYWLTVVRNWPRGGLVFDGAGHGAGLTTDAAAQVDQHAVTLAPVPPADGRSPVAGSGNGLRLNLGDGDQGRPCGEGGDPG
ncbi:hypothetical protein KAM364_08270 [Aeromonas caviae]|nr:hypothetical protein KAM364_08270 [Aeromonas caviae]